MKQQHTDLFNRPPRVRPTWSSETVRFPAPPMSQASQPLSWFGLLMPLMSAAIFMGAMLLAGRGQQYLALAVPMILGATLSFVYSYRSAKAQQRTAAGQHAREQAFYDECCRKAQEDVERLNATEWVARSYLHAGPEILLRIAGAAPLELTQHPLFTALDLVGVTTRELQSANRLWERRLGDDDFLELRIGIGRMPASTTIEMPAPAPTVPVDEALYRWQRENEHVANAPITIPLAHLGSLSLAGPLAETLPVLHALLWQITVLHSPADVRLAVVAPPDAQPAEWKDWLRKLPHCGELYAQNDEQVAHLLSVLLGELSKRRDQKAARSETASLAFPTIVLVVGDLARVRHKTVVNEILASGSQYNMAVVFMVPHWSDAPGECACVIDIARQRQTRWMVANGSWQTNIERVDGNGDIVTLQQTHELARKLETVDLAEGSDSQGLPRHVSLLSILNLTYDQLANPPHWATPPDPRRGWHKVAMGKRADQSLVELDLFERSHGSHGIVAGMTGAGKSVLLQGLIASLVLHHSPQSLQLFLIDFKGGAALGQFSGIPHCAGFVSDLGGRLAERAITAIKSEIFHRKTVFVQASKELGMKIENVTDYRTRAIPQGCEPMPNLLIVVDEYDEMVQQYAWFVDELARVVKQGRSLGVHLLIASQQPARVVKDTIKTQLKYFIALRLGSSDDSQEMIGKPDAAFLPNDAPGRAYFHSGETNELFQVASIIDIASNGTPEEGHRLVWEIDEKGDRVIRREEGRKGNETDLEIMTRELAKSGFLAGELQRTGWEPRPIWQPVLPDRLLLGDACDSPPRAAPGAARHPAELLQELGQHAELAAVLPQVWQIESKAARLKVVVGRVDIPQESRQEACVIDLAKGHMVVVGEAGSGKTTLLRTMLLSLALTHSPEELWCYTVDAGGQGLLPLRDLPHLGHVIEVRDQERVNRLISFMLRTIQEREQLFRDTGVEGLADYALQTGERLPLIVVMIDKYALLHHEFADKYGEAPISEDIIQIARKSLKYGLHLVITADSLRDIPYKLLSFLTQRLALRMREPHDYSDFLSARVTSALPEELPGRALLVLPEAGLAEAQLALPSLERLHRGAESDAASSAFAQEEIVETSALLERGLTTYLRSLAASVRRIKDACGYAGAPALKTLPEELPFADLGAALDPVALGDELYLPLGREKQDYDVAGLWLTPDTPHGLVLGKRGTGKTQVLHTILASLARRYDAARLKVMIIEPRKHELAFLRDTLPHLDHALGYVHRTDQLPQLAAFLRDLRLQGDSATRWVVVIDDLDAAMKGMRDQFAVGGETVFGELCAWVERHNPAVHFIFAGNFDLLPGNQLMSRLNGNENGLVLCPNKFDAGTVFFNQRFPLDANTPTLPGRGVLFNAGEMLHVQVAQADAAVWAPLAARSA